MHMQSKRSCLKALWNGRLMLLQARCTELYIHFNLQRSFLTISGGHDRAVAVMGTECIHVQVSVRHVRAAARTNSLLQPRSATSSNLAQPLYPHLCHGGLVWRFVSAGRAQ